MTDSLLCTQNNPDNIKFLIPKHLEMYRFSIEGYPDNFWDLYSH